MEPFGRFTRRDVLAGAGGALAVAAMAPLAARASVRAPGIVLCDPRSETSQRFAAVLARAGSTAIALEADPVRQWYAGLRETVERHGSVAALTDWSRYLMLRGLAAELRRHPRFEARHQCACDGVSHHLPAWAAPSEDELSGARWPETVARLILEMPERHRSAAYPSLHLRTAPVPGAASSHFSWLIA